MQVLILYLQCLSFGSVAIVWRVHNSLVTLVVAALSTERSGLESVPGQTVCFEISTPSVLLAIIRGVTSGV